MVPGVRAWTPRKVTDLSVPELEPFAADLTSGQTLRPEAGKSGRPAADVEAAMAAIASLDLSAVRRKVVEDKGWSDRIADYAELRYRRFLCMYRLNPRLALVPHDDIDAFWHQHILFTREYARDCEKLFGSFLHHAPGVGGDDEAELLHRGYVETARFYADTFGENYAATEPEGLPSDWLALFVPAPSADGHA